MTDQELIEQIAKGNNERAFQTLVQRYQDLVINTCYGFLQNREDAQDVAQEVFIQVHRSINNFRGDAKLSTWLYRISVNRSLNLIRKNKYKKMVRSIGSFFGGGKEGQEAQPLQIANTATMDAQQTMENAEHAQALQSALAKLPENQCIAFTLHKMEGLPQRQIAEIMDTTPSAVMSLAHRAKANLKKLLYKYYEENL